MNVKLVTLLMLLSHAHAHTSERALPESDEAPTPCVFELADEEAATPLALVSTGEAWSKNADMFNELTLANKNLETELSNTKEELTAARTLIDQKYAITNAFSDLMKQPKPKIAFGKTYETLLDMDRNKQVKITRSVSAGALGLIATMLATDPGFRSLFLKDPVIRGFIPLPSPALWKPYLPTDVPHILATAAGVGLLTYFLWPTNKPSFTVADLKEVTTNVAQARTDIETLKTGYRSLRVLVQKSHVANSEELLNVVQARQKESEEHCAMHTNILKQVLLHSNREDIEATMQALPWQANCEITTLADNDPEVAKKMHKKSLIRRIAKFCTTQNKGYLHE